CKGKPFFPLPQMFFEVFFYVFRRSAYLSKAGAKVEFFAFQSKCFRRFFERFFNLRWFSDG
ncbi:MAG: hypothetical protein MJZ90_12370, partial [Bacteroidales bacterium]|nr:hypothetical protein [Bacteroidales bacterium]